MGASKLGPLQAMIRYFAGKQSRWLWQDREDFYSLSEGYYNNTAYKSLADGGYRDYLLAEYGADVATKVAGIYNPIKQVVDTYRYIFAGKFTGDKPSIRVVPNKQAIMSPLQQIYSWTNIDIEKRALTHGGSLLGTYGIRIVARSKPSPRIYLRFEHPKRVKDIQYDDRGNVQQILLEYRRQEGKLGEERETHVITELLTPESFEMYRDGDRWDDINKRKNGTLWRYENKLGVTPYVMLRHIAVNDDWGLPAWHGQGEPIDAANVLASHIDEQIRRHVRVKWFMVAGGKPPINVDLGDTSVAYVQIDPSMPYPTPMLEPLIAPLNLADSIAALEQKVDAIKSNLPELRALDGKFLAGQSGETIAQLRLPAEELILDARAQYEDALQRADKIALSWGIRLGMWDLGTGTGSVEAANRAFEQGYEDHAFEERAALPATAWERADLQNRIYTGIETLDRAGAISLIEKVRRANPEWTAVQVQAEVERIEAANTVVPPDTGSEGAADPLAGFLGSGDQAPEPVGA